MQYYTPIPSGGQALAGIPFSETQASCRPPQIIGEGDVASFVLPDGTVQLYFVPSPFPRCPPSPNYPPFITQQQQQQQQQQHQQPQQQPWNSYTEAWFIRSVPDQLIVCPNPNVSRPQCQPDNSNPSFQQSRYQSRTGYQLKFHNDGWTSTTDIHQFDPSLQQRAWFSRYNAGTQAASPPPTPPEPPEPQPIEGHPCRCEKPCHCFNSYGRSDLVHNIYVATTYEPERNKIIQFPYSNFQIGERSQSVEVLHDKKQKKTTRFGSLRPRSSRGCDSGWLERASKATATFTSQATGSGGAASGTQTRCGAVVPVRRAGSFLRAVPELWLPASPAARATLASPSPPSSGSDD